ncbi:MAG: hypothetical protein KJ052_21195, partial [Candidatus Hydrogenedentes bacterium]|nr:hypothetical protein [Candidatus Hydrogenedentota bacterium]
MNSISKLGLGVVVAAVICIAPLGVAQDSALSLEKKAEVFFADLQRNYVFNGQTMCKLRLPTASQPNATYNMPDNAYMTGIYTG